jgi:DinB superfamily
MRDLETALADMRAAVDEFDDAAARSASSWTTPRAPGKWSPAQIAEHVVRAVDEFANVAAGAPSLFPNLPFFLRPVLRRVVFARVVRTRRFPSGRTSKAMNPTSGPASPAEGHARLAAALARLDDASRAAAARGGMVDSSIFGTVSVEDFVTFQAEHIRHHTRQLPGAAR